MKRELPESLKPVYFDFHWSQKKLWSLALSSRSMEISALTWLLDYPIWASDPPEKLYDLSPAQVIDNLETYPKHALRIKEADTSFPLHVMYWKERWAIMDGFHRLIKAHLAGEKTISVYEVPQTAIPHIGPDPDQPSGFLKHELARRDTLLRNK